MESQEFYLGSTEVLGEQRCWGCASSLAAAGMLPTGWWLEKPEENAVTRTTWCSILSSVQFVSCSPLGGGGGRHLPPTL